MSSKVKSRETRTMSVPISSMGGGFMDLELWLSFERYDTIFDSSPGGRLMMARSKLGVRSSGRRGDSVELPCSCNLQICAQYFIDAIDVVASTTEWCDAMQIQNPWFGNNVIWRESTVAESSETVSSCAR